METLSVRIINIHCYFYEEDDGDEVFLVINGEKVWPANEKWYRMKAESLTVDHVIDGFKVNERIELEVWDYDYLSPNDYMGKISMLIDKPGGPYTTDMQLADPKQIARYSITWEIIKPA